MTPSTPISPSPSQSANAPQPTPPCTPTGDGDRRKAPQGTSVTTPEDEALTKAWIRISEDAIVGSYQKGEVFFKDINDYYDIKPAYCQKRDNKSSERRVKKLMTECLAFAGCVAKVNNARPSGTNGYDVLHLATALFKKLEISSVSEECGPPFKFLSCWRLLKEHPKFDLLLNPPAAVSDSTAPDDNNDEEISETTAAEEFKRPINRKRAKSTDHKTDVETKRIKIAEATLKAQEERNELLKTQQEIMLFTSTADTIDPIVNEYMTIMPKRALDRLKAIESSSSAPETVTNSSISEYQ